MNRFSIILVRPKLGENIGLAARAMLNFNFTDLRIVNPKCGWPNYAAEYTSANGLQVIQAASVFSNLRDAVTDLDYVYATSARKRDMNLEVISVSDIEEDIKVNHSTKKIGIMFGSESSGLSNHDISFANKILTIPINPDCSSINLAMSVGIICYQISKSHLSSFKSRIQNKLANRIDLINMFQHLEQMLEQTHFYQVPEKKMTMNNNMRNIFNRIPNLSKNEFNTLMGIFSNLFSHKK